MTPLRLKGLGKDERGASLIEFGFLAPVLALMAMGIADLSRALSDRFTIQAAVNRSIELLQAHPVTISGSATSTTGSTSCGNYCFVKTEAQNAAGTGATVTLTTWHQCIDASDNIVMQDFYTDCATGQDDEGRYVRVKIDKTFTGGFYFHSIAMSTSNAVRVQ
jgi:Flp pilus assembly protein TadG